MSEKCPCIECITFTICRNKSKTDCSILLDYINNKCDKVNWKHKRKLLEKLYNRQVLFHTKYFNFNLLHNTDHNKIVSIRWRD